MLSPLIALCRALRRLPRFGVFIAFASVLFAHAALADGTGKTNGNGSGNPPPDPKMWTGFGWGLGIAADFDLGGKRVTGAQIDTANVVRVTDTSGNVGVSFVLEAHYFAFEWQTGQVWCKNPNLIYNCNNIATGPFVAVEIGGGTTTKTDSGPITGYALGWMVGLHHPNAPATSSWNFGVGLRVDPASKVLADGVAANRPPPPGITTTDQLFKKEPRYGIMLLSSFSF